MAKWNNAQAPSFGHISGVAVFTRAAEENDSQGRSVLFVREESKEEEEKGVQLWICLIANYLFVLNDGCNRETFCSSFYWVFIIVKNLFRVPEAQAYVARPLPRRISRWNTIWLIVVWSQKGLRSKNKFQKT